MKRAVEFWIPMGWARPEDMASLAQGWENDGWDGLMVSDTQCLHPDPFVMMTLAATATLSLGTSVSIAVGDDLVRARHSVANIVASVARFSVMSSRVVGPMSGEQRRVYGAIAANYDMNRHGGHGAQVNALTDEFIDTMAVVGPPSRCIERLLELIELGIDHVLLAPPLASFQGGDAELKLGYRRLVQEVIPGVRDALRQ